MWGAGSTLAADATVLGPFLTGAAVFEALGAYKGAGRI